MGTWTLRDILIYDYNGLRNILRTQGFRPKP